MLNKKIRYSLVGFLFILLLSVVFYINQKSVKKNILQMQQAGNKVQFNQDFDSQEATLRGIITKVRGRTLTVRNSASGSIKDYTASEDMFFQNYIDNFGPATPSSDLKQLKIDKNVIIKLKLIDGVFKISSIQYLPDLAPPPLN